MMAWLYWKQMQTKQAIEDAATRASSSAHTNAVMLNSTKVAAEETGKQAALQAEELKKELEVNTQVSKATHTLVDGNMGVQLKLNAVLAQRLADVTGLPSDAELAATTSKASDAYESTTILSEKKGLCE